MHSVLCPTALRLLPYTSNLKPYTRYDPIVLNALNDPNHLNDPNNLNDPNHLDDPNYPNDIIDQLRSYFCLSF